MKKILVMMIAAIATSIAVAGGRVVTDLSGEGWTLDGEAVTVPHTWNAIDGTDGIGERRHHANSVAAQSYSHRRGVYRRNLPAAKAGRRYFVRFRGASQRATVRVNGTDIGHHVGAFTAFCCEATRQMSTNGVNLLEVEVDNIYDPDIPPASGDFTVYGGLHRGVELIETDPVCIDCVTDGADGVRLDADPDTGDVTAYVSVDGGTNEVQRFSFPSRELWSPENPCLYEIDVAIAQGGGKDAVRKTFGFRRAEFREDGFYLNGVKRTIRGVNMHSDFDGCGWAVPKGRRAKDIAMVKELGADGLRAAHYPHDDETYAECDKQGLLVWCEYPNLGYFTPTEAYRRNAMQGIREMVAQFGAHPSIIAWSVSNEYFAGKKSPAEWLERLLREFTAEVRRLDPSRPSAAATFKPLMTAANAIPDVLGFNFYPGWYKQEPDEMPVTIDAALAETRRGMIAVTEYGAGGNADCHESPDVRNAPLGAFHSEEYQAWVHHFNYLGLKDDPRLWGTFVWCMFDFGADARREGSRFGLNDKGLVAYDHETRKDAFWFYKANWTKEPFLHLVGSRMASTTNSAVTVMAFWNGPGEVALKVNGENCGARTPDGVKTAIWRGVRLRPGDNEIEVSAGGLSKSAHWRLEDADGGNALVEKRAKPLEWLFPTGDETPHEGMAFADGVTGVLAWGGGDTLKLTVGRADLWDHRGGYTWTDAQSYTNITDAILKGDKERLEALFRKETPPGEPRNPFMLPLGRVEVKIPGATLKRGTLDVKTGVGEIEFEFGGTTCRTELAMSKASRAFALKLPDGLTFEAKPIHSMEFPVVQKRLTPLGHKPAVYSDNGFTWELPADESVTLEFAKRGRELTIGTWRGNDSAALRETSFSQIRAESEAHWAKFWREGARVKVPDPVIQGLFDYGMYRFGAMTDPDGVPAGLQGPWIEDNWPPPWSGDYHFNINVQECYAPAYRGGHFANMKPLFKMVLSWKPILRENARKFAGVDGYVLPHSVSDQGVNIGGFWTGTIDHGSTAWVADMMWRYVKYSRDVDFLRRDAYDYMKGAMRVYRAMMTEDGKGNLAFPTGPSPEWGGKDFDKAVGRNPSFQLAAAHRLVRNLIAAAAMLGEKPDAMWLDVERRLPLASIDDAQGGILLFENRPLSESHRHHSHMAGLFPFDIFDLSDAATAATVEKTYAHWRAKGTDLWTGWCVPWAAVLNVHAGESQAAVKLLHDWDEYFTNPGHASRCHPWKFGFTKEGRPPRIGRDGRHAGHEIMQMDGQCAFAAAVLEMMAHEVNGKTEFFRGCPPGWKDVSFENIALSDGRRASGRRLNGKATVAFAE